jgi:hypothetical protein
MAERVLKLFLEFQPARHGLDDSQLKWTKRLHSIQQPFGRLSGAADPYEVLAFNEENLFPHQLPNAIQFVGRYFVTIYLRHCHLVHPHTKIALVVASTALLAAWRFSQTRAISGLVAF